MFAKYLDLGGLAFISVDADDYNSTCHGVDFPMIRAGQEAFLANEDQSGEIPSWFTLSPIEDTPSGTTPPTDVEDLESNPWILIDEEAPTEKAQEESTVEETTESATTEGPPEYYYDDEDFSEEDTTPTTERAVVSTLPTKIDVLTTTDSGTYPVNESIGGEELESDRRDPEEWESLTTTELPATTERLAATERTTTTEPTTTTERTTTETTSTSPPQPYSSQRPQYFTDSYSNRVEIPEANTPRSPDKTVVLVENPVMAKQLKFPAIFANNIYYLYIFLNTTATPNTPAGGLS